MGMHMPQFACGSQKKNFGQFSPSAPLRFRVSLGFVSALYTPGWPAHKLLGDSSVCLSLCSRNTEVIDINSKPSFDLAVGLQT